MQVDGIHPGASEEEVGPIQHTRAFEWASGAALGSCVAGYVAVPFGIGCGIAAGVVAMQATRAGMRAMVNAGWFPNLR